MNKYPSVGFDADGGVLVCGDRAMLISWSVAEGKELSRRACAYGHQFGPPAIDPRGGRLAVCIHDHIEFLCTRRLVPVAPPLPADGHPHYSPDGTTLAVRNSKDVRLFAADFPAKTPLVTLRQPDGELADDDDITATLFSPDGSLLLTLSEFGHHARLWEVASGRLLVPIVTPGDLTGATFSPDSKRLLLQAGGRSLWYGIKGGEWQSFIVSATSPCEALIFAPDGTLGVRSYSPEDGDWGTLSLWSPSQPSSLRARVTLHGMGGLRPYIAFSPSGELAFLRTNFRISFWDGSAQARYRDIVWQKDPNGLAYGSSDRLWASDGPLVGVVGRNDIQWTNSPFIGKRGATSLLANSTHLITGWRDGTLRVHGNDARPTASSAHASSSIRALALSPDASRIAAGTEDGEVLVYRMEDPRVVIGASRNDRHRDGVTGVAFLGPNLLLSAGLDGRLSLWKVTEGELRLALRLRLPRPVRAMVVQPDGRRVAVLLDRDRAVRLLDLPGLLNHLAGLGVDRETPKSMPTLPALTPPAPRPLPAFAGVDLPTGVHGLRAELFSDPWFDHRVKVRHDARFAFDWGEGVPDKVLPGPAFAIRWTGWLVPPKRGKYKLWARGDGKVWVQPWNGNSMQDYFAAGQSADLDLTYEGRPLPIRLDFAKTQPKAAFSLEWSRDGSATKEAIPSGVLYHTEAEAIKAAAAVKDGGG